MSWGTGACSGMENDSEEARRARSSSRRNVLSVCVSFGQRGVCNLETMWVEKSISVLSLMADSSASSRNKTLILSKREGPSGEPGPLPKPRVTLH